jgi:ABC-type transporter lipoprotein component MlaA
VKPHRHRWLLALLGIAALLSACAHPVLRRDWSGYDGPGAPYFHEQELPPPSFPDPLEPWNRGVSLLNHGLIVGIADPIGRVYRWVIPHVVREHVRSFAANLIFPRNLVGNLLQAHWRGARDETFRFAINTTVGGLGFFDPASHWGIEAAPEDMGQTFALWGWHPSTYLVLPVYGPSSLRDTVGLVPDAYLDPATYYFPAGPVLSFNDLVDAIPAYREFVETTYDPYDDARVLWTLNRDEEIYGHEFSNRHEDSAQVQTLELAFLAPRDPAFGGRLRSGEATIPATGRALPYSYRLQKGRAPIVFLLPGIGSHRQSGSALALAEMVFERGFSVVVLSSALNFEFMQRAASVSVPGHAPADAHDVHVALDAIVRDLSARKPDRLGPHVLMGYSLGAFHAFFIAAEERSGASDLVGFDRYIALDAPVRLLHGLERIDSFYNAPLAFPADERAEQTLHILRKALHVGKQALAARDAESYGRVESVNLGGGSLTPAAELPFSNLEAEYLIGLAFRRTLQGIIYASQEREDLGVLESQRGPLRRWAAYQEIADYSFAEYLYAFLLPYYRDRLQRVASADELVAQNDLHAIADALRGNPKLRLFANRNDFLTSAEDVVWLTQLLGKQHVRFFPTGGHLGNLHRPEVQHDIMDALADLAPPGGRTK